MYKNNILVADLLKNERHITKLMKNGKVVYYPLQEYKEEEPQPEPEPAEEYFHFLALADGTKVKLPTVLQYSTDKTTWTQGDGSLKTIDNGEKIYFKGNNSQINGVFKNLTTGKAAIEGNSMSLLYGDDFKGKKTLPAQNCFLELFGSSTIITTAKDFILPATTLSKNCYYQMFAGCTSLTTAPELPATALAAQCYWAMFSGCSHLVRAPYLPAKSLPSHCYSSMFSNCGSLNYIKTMQSTIGQSVTNGWVNNVATKGTFLKRSSLTLRGANGIPSNWTVGNF